MLRPILLALCLGLIPAAALAQSAATPNEQALGQRIMAEVNANLTCSAQVIALEAELKKVRDQLAEATAKPDVAAKKK